MNKSSNLKLIIIIVGITCTLFPIINNSLNFIVRNFDKDVINGDNFSHNKKNLKISQYHVLYSENFDDGIADYWTNIGGTWIVENDKYKATGITGERVRSYYINQSFSYYIYEGDFNLVSGNEMQIIFNIQDIFSGVDQGHYCQITLFYEDPGGRNDTAVLYSNQNGQIVHMNATYDFTHNQWYHFSVRSAGDNVNFFLNNSLVLSYSGLFYSSGYIGVKSMYGPIAYWDNIKVSELNYSRKIHIDGNSDWVDLKNLGNCSGNGTYSVPYVIEDLVLNAGGSGSCILIENSDVYFKIENCTAYNSGGYPNSAIRLSNVSNGQLINNSANNNGYGINLESSNNISIIGNIVKNNYVGIKLDESNYTTISGNTANNNSIGIYFYYDCDYNTISGNTANDNSNVGIYLENSDDNIFSGNTVDYNYYGIRLIQCDKNNISGNNANYNNEGIRCYNSFNNIISGNTVNNNGHGIIFWFNCQNNKILRNNINNNARGISMLSHYNNYNNISGNIVNFNDIGIQLSEENENNLIWDNTINESNRYGIYLYYSDNNDIRFNTITNNDIGIYIYLSYSNEISNNTYSGNNVDVKRYKVPRFPFEIVLIVIVIIIAMVITGMQIYRKRVSRPKTKSLSIDKHGEKAVLYTKEPIKEIPLKPEMKSEIKTPPVLEKLEVVQDELDQSSNIEQLRSNYKKEIEEIRRRVHRENLYISLDAIDEAIKLLDKLNLKERNEIQYVFLENLLTRAIRFCVRINENLINKSHINKAFQDIYRIEVDMMRTIQSIKEIDVIQEEEVIKAPEEIPKEEEAIKEELIVSTPIEQTKEIEVMQEEELIKTPEEIPLEEQVTSEKAESTLEEILKGDEALPEVLVAVSKPEEQPKEIKPPEPKIIYCPFCGLEKDEVATFCPQCGMIFKKK